MLKDRGLRIKPYVDLNLRLLLQLRQNQVHLAKIRRFLQKLLGDRDLEVKCLVQLLPLNFLRLKASATPTDSRPDFRVTVLEHCILRMDL